MRKKDFTVSLIITTYNAPKMLELCLSSVYRQTCLPDEIVIADDGSGDDTRTLIEDFAANHPVPPIIHTWHEDKGFRLTAIRNKGLLTASCDYIIQIDGDIILERHFIEDHIRYAAQGVFYAGCRVMLTQERTEEIMRQGVESAGRLSVFSKGLDFRYRALRLPLLAPLLYKYTDHLEGANMAYWRNDALAVNGYNEDFVGWGYEDYEFPAVLKCLAGGRKNWHCVQ